MLQAYSLNITVPTNSAIAFNNVILQKGCTTTISGDATIQLNKCGVYMVECDCSSATASTIQLFKNGVALPQAQSTGTSPNFLALVQVSEDNTRCPCSSATNLQVKNVGASSATFTDANVVITKVV